MIGLPIGGVSGEISVYGFLELDFQGRGLFHEIPSMPHQESPLSAVGIQNFRLHGQTIDSGAMDGGKINVVGLGAQIGRASNQTAGVGMDVACIPLLLFEKPSDRQVVTSSGFDGTNTILYVVFLHRISNEASGHFQARSCDLNRKRFEQHVAIKVGDARACF